MKPSVGTDRSVRKVIRPTSAAGHFMPASLLASQLATLEPVQPDEDGVTVDAGGPPEQVAADIRARLGLPG